MELIVVKGKYTLTENLSLLGPGLRLSTWITIALGSCTRVTFPFESNKANQECTLGKQGTRPSFARITINQM